VSAPGRSLTWAVWINRFGPFAGLVAVYLLFAVLAPDSFTSARNLETTARQSVMVGIAALGMTVVIISGGIDLSIGSIVALTTVVIGVLIKEAKWSPSAAAAAGVLAGVACGALNGVLITRLRVVPFIVTLGTLLVYRGVAEAIAREERVTPLPTWLGELMNRPGEHQRWMLLAPGVWVMILLAAAVSAMLRYTRLGRHAFAIGSNEQAARLCGVPVDRVKLTVYALGGLFAGLSGLMYYAYLGGGDPNEAVGHELRVIAAVVIGGGSLSGGEGSVLGSLVGTLIMQTIDSGCSQMGWPNRVQKIVTGAIIVAAVALDRLRHRRTP
jgi:ribose transport system permease protein